MKTEHLIQYFNFRVVTQKYGKGIVQYGSEQKTTFYSGSHPGPGGRYDDICDVTGKIYLELDFSTPVVGCPNCSIDGYTGTTIASGDTFELITEFMKVLSLKIRLVRFHLTLTLLLFLLQKES